MLNAIGLSPSRSVAVTSPDVRELAAALGLSVLFIVVTLVMRPPLPIDETRYLTVAWEMWRSGDLLVPRLNGEAYSHKPPLLFWLINAIWAVTGPQEWSARLVPALFMPISVFLTFQLGRAIDGPALGARAALVLASFVVFAVMGTAVLFDAMLTVAVILALLGLVRAANGRMLSGMALFALALGLGGLAKGPVILVHTLPAALLAPLWMPKRPASWGKWYGGIAAVLAAGAVVGLAWAVPAALAGGQKFGSLILWEQTSGRVVSAFAHKRPFWFYLPLVPILLFPWVLSRRLWTGSGDAAASSPIWRLPLIVAVADLVLFSAISSKQIHYLLPALPAVAVLVAHRLGPDREDSPEEPGFATLFALCGIGLLAALVVVPHFYPTFPSIHPEVGILLIALALPFWWLRRSLSRMVPLASALLILIAHAEGRFSILPAQDLRWIDARLRKAGPIAMVGGYQGEFGFGARLTEPVKVLTPEEVLAWRRDNPHGVMVSVYKVPGRNLDGPPLVARPYRGGWIGLWAPVEPADGSPDDDAAAAR